MSYSCFRTTDSVLWAAAGQLVYEVAQHTGYPNLEAWPGRSLISQIRERQEASVGVWVAEDDQTGLLVGHGLLQPAIGQNWAEYPNTVTAWSQHRLVELGGLAVHWKFQRNGIARRLQGQRIALAAGLGYQVCVAVWEGGPSQPLVESDPRFHLCGKRTDQHGYRVLDYVVQGGR